MKKVESKPSSRWKQNLGSKKPKAKTSQNWIFVESALLLPRTNFVPSESELQISSLAFSNTGFDNG